MVVRSSVFPRHPTFWDDGVSHLVGGLISFNCRQNRPSPTLLRGSFGGVGSGLLTTFSVRSVSWPSMYLSTTTKEHNTSYWRSKVKVRKSDKVLVISPVSVITSLVSIQSLFFLQSIWLETRNSSVMIKLIFTLFYDTESYGECFIRKLFKNNLDLHYPE